jgi:hypothetical protein
MILILVCILIALLIALWLSTMALWWQTEEGLAAKTLKRRDAIRAFNKAARLGRRGWYGGVRYSKKAASWGNKKATGAFVAVFPQSKPAFVDQDPLIGLEHGPSSYFLAHLSKKSKKKKMSNVKKIESEEHLSEE